MRNDHLPARLAADSLEALAAERHSRTPVVYIAVLASVALGCASLPLIHVPVAVRAAGMIRPTLEKHEIRASLSGMVAESWMVEGGSVTASAPLVRLADPTLAARESLLGQRRHEISVEIRDLERLLGSDLRVLTGSDLPSSARYAAEASAFRSSLARRMESTRSLGSEASRAARLAELGVLPAAQAERLRFEMAEDDAARLGFIADTRARWTRELTELRIGSQQVEEDLVAVRTERELRLVLAPVTGSLEDVRQLAPGSFVAAGERLATISPSAKIRVEAHLGSRDVALVRPGAPVLLRVHGYDPGEWGLLEGRVASVAEDFTVVGGRAVFRILVDLERDHMILRDGRTGPLRKGIAVEARIVVARASLYRLLRENLSEWVHPRRPDD